jgi:membrane-associated protease RseP (regulator of RpoE activity)
MNSEFLQRAKNIVGDKFEIMHQSRFRNHLIFSARQDSIDDQQLSEIIGELLKNGLLPTVDQKNDQILLHVVLEASRKMSKVWINIVLFVLTVISTMMAGAVLVGQSFLFEIERAVFGWKYSLAIISILTAHEFGHYFAARYHKINASLPYYIPFPGTLFGTLGAFIRLKSPIKDRQSLLDVGAAGPIAGFIFSLLFLIIGYWQLPDREGIIRFVETIHPWDMQGEGINLVLGKSLLFAFFNDILAGGRLPMNELYHFPFIFAGWIGLLVTAINLMPIGQLDGGHILYALVEKRARLFGISAFALLILLNIILIVQYFSFVWVLWIILIFVLIGFRHPPTINDNLHLSSEKKVIGWFCLILFILCFPPLPIYIY